MERLCQAIDMPEEAMKAILDIHRDPDFHPCIDALFHPETWDQNQRLLEQALGDDPQGWKMLCCHLRGALRTRSAYQSMGISDEIYFATMAIFSRMVREHKESFGVYGFDRAFWTVRQLSCVLFRIGELEYELTERGGRKVVSLHIPSDADLNTVRLRASWQDAKAFLRRTFPEHADAEMVCHSWLLSPDLARFLSQNSKILRFQQSFSIVPDSDGRADIRLWVFKNPNLALSDLPEQTSLQRALKTHLLNGGEFSLGCGTLSDNPFHA